MSFADLAALVISGIAESGSSGASAMAGLTGSNGDWYILGRDTIRSYVEFSEDSDRMSDLANVFPLIFFMVAALSSLTSMTRMVEDHRAEIGTLKSLGFSTLSISIKYIGYALAASLLGGGAGLLFGGIALPSLIYYEWGIMYMLPKLEITISPVVALYSVGAAVLATAGAAYAACYATLLSKPAELRRCYPSRRNSCVPVRRNPASGSFWSTLHLSGRGFPLSARSARATFSATRSVSG